MTRIEMTPLLFSPLIDLVNLTLMKLLVEGNDALRFIVKEASQNHLNCIAAWKIPNASGHWRGGRPEDAHGKQLQDSSTSEEQESAFVQLMEPQIFTT